MFKKLGVLLVMMMLVVSCNKRYEQAMKSTDKDLILKTANELFAEGKYAFAIELYSKVASSFSGTEEAANILYNSAEANFQDRNYRLAAHQFKNFYVTNPVDPRAEDAAYKSAYSYYTDSPKYNLDQTSTYSAMTELQSFINMFPESPNVAQANGYIDELRQKLERKAFEIAKIYHKTLKFKAAAIAFDNMLDEYPDTKFREEAMMYSLRSKYELALKYSRFETEELRFQNTITQHKLLLKAFPQTKFKDEADKMLVKTEEALVKHKETAAKIEEHKKSVANNTVSK